MDLSLLPVLSLIMVMSALHFFVQKMYNEHSMSLLLKDLSSEEARKKILQMVIHRSFSHSIGGSYLFISGVILTLIGNIPEWIVWVFWAFLIINFICFLIFGIENDPAKGNETQVPSIVLHLYGYVKIAIVPVLIFVFAYTVYAAWTMI